MAVQIACSSNDKFAKFVSLIFDDEHRQSTRVLLAQAACTAPHSFVHDPFSVSWPHRTPCNFPRLSDFRWLTLVIVNYSSQRRSRRHLHRSNFSHLRAFFLKQRARILCLTKASLESNFDVSLTVSLQLAPCHSSFHSEPPIQVSHLAHV